MREKCTVVTSDTTSMNSGKKTDINKRFCNYVIANFERDVHATKCMFHVNEI